MIEYSCTGWEVSKMMRCLYHTNCSSRFCPQYLEWIIWSETGGILMKPTSSRWFRIHSSHLFYVIMDINTDCRGLPEINFDNSQKQPCKNPLATKMVTFLWKSNANASWGPLFLTGPHQCIDGKPPKHQTPLTRNLYGIMYKPEFCNLGPKCPAFESDFF